MVGWAETIRRLASILSYTDKSLLNDLKKDSNQLAIISEEFPRWLRERERSPETNVEIVCFIEEKATGRLNQKV